MLLYFKVALETIAWWHSIEHHRPQHTTASISRPCIHLVLSSCVVFWPLFDVTDWSWRLNTLVPAALLARFIYKGAWCKNPDHDVEVQILSRSSSPSELLWGPVQLAAVLIYLGQYHFMTTRAVVLAAALGVGDGWAAPVIGSRYGRHVYQIPLASPKSMEGSVVGVLLGTVSGCYLYLYLSGLPFLPLRVLLSYGAIAAVVEGTSPGSLDNLMISLVLLCTMDRVQDWLPG
jgi:CDP-diglyceride synthetase